MLVRWDGDGRGRLGLSGLEGQGFRIEGWNGGCAKVSSATRRGIKDRDSEFRVGDKSLSSHVRLDGKMKLRFLDCDTNTPRNPGWQAIPIPVVCRSMGRKH